MAKVWVAELEIKGEGFHGSWLDVHHTRDGARRGIAQRATIHGVTDLHERAARQDLATSDDVSSSALAKDGPREITWVINRHTVED